MPSIIDIASSNPSFDVLQAVLGFVDGEIPDANLVATLSAPDANVTVFAPSDAAFGQLAADLGFAGDTTDEGAVTAFLAGALEAETIRDVLLYHVSAGAQTLAELNTTGTIATLNGATIDSLGPVFVDLEPDLINPSVFLADVEADNGIIQAVDRVLLPIDLAGNDAPTITGIVAASGGIADADGTDFDLLLAAVQAAGLAGALDDPDADLTVFAPNDAAFVSLAQSLGFGGDDEGDAFGFIVEALTLLGGGDPIPLLTEILTYHVASGSLQSSQVVEADTIGTLQGGEIGVDAENLELVDLDPGLDDPMLIATDIQAANGVVHVIDEVLQPLSVTGILSADDVDFVLADGEDNLFITGDGNDSVDGNGGDDVISLGTGDDVGLGGDGDDAIGGSSGNDTLFGGAGSDRLFGGRGSDEIDGGDGRDFISGSVGEDNISGGGARDVIFGGRGQDTIDGGSGRDFISGGVNDDVLSGGAGRDGLWGGDGMDVFIFSEGHHFDRIFDFEIGTDKIDVTGFGLTGFEDIADSITDGNARTKIEFGEGDNLFLDGVREAELSASDFIFVETPEMA